MGRGRVRVKKQRKFLKKTTKLRKIRANKKRLGADAAAEVQAEPSEAGEAQDPAAEVPAEAEPSEAQEPASASGEKKPKALDKPKPKPQSFFGDSSFERSAGSNVRISNAALMSIAGNTMSPPVVGSFLMMALAAIRLDKDAESAWVKPPKKARWRARRSNARDCARMPPAILCLHLQTPPS